MVLETAKMSERGQIIIPKDVRESISATTDTIFAVSTLDTNTIIMRKLDTSSLVQEFDKLRKNTKKLSKKRIEEEINAARA